MMMVDENGLMSSFLLMDGLLMSWLMLKHASTASAGVSSDTMPLLSPTQSTASLFDHRPNLLAPGQSSIPADTLSASQSVPPASAKLLNLPPAKPRIEAIPDVDDCVMGGQLPRESPSSSQLNDVKRQWVSLASRRSSPVSGSRRISVPESKPTATNFASGCQAIPLGRP